MNRNGSDLVFTRPNGEAVPAVPSGQCVDADAGCAALLKASEDGGLEIAPRTAVPRWMGERMDYGEVLGALSDRTRSM